MGHGNAHGSRKVPSGWSASIPEHEVSGLGESSRMGWAGQCGHGKPDQPVAQSREMKGKESGANERRAPNVQQRVRSISSVPSSLPNVLGSGQADVGEVSGEAARGLKRNAIMTR